MKVLYVKNTSERNKKFQLQTMIYEENGQKFVKKSVLCDEALPHLYKMQENYEKLSNAIINPKVKLAKIIDNDERSLTFEFIEGESLEKRFYKVIKDKDKIDPFIAKYISFIKNSFKTTLFNSQEVSSEFIKIFGDFDYSVFDKELCFNGISNIDLIFSNIIYKDDEIYIIDYEWVFEFNIPIAYIVYRMSLSNDIMLHRIRNNKLYKNVESYFIFNYVCESSFYEYKINYIKNRLNLKQLSDKKEIKCLEQELLNSQEYIQLKEKNIIDQQEQLEHKELEIQKLISHNQELTKLADSMRIKNRIKNIFNIKREENLS